MASVEQWRPFREIERMRDEFERLMDHFTEDWAQGHESPRMECFLEDHTMTARVELPGVDPNDIEVDVTGSCLTIRAHRKEKHEHLKRHFLRREMRYGTMERTMELPAGVKADDIRATYHDGVLELVTSIPRESQTKEMKIQVTHGHKAA